MWLKPYLCLYQAAAGLTGSLWPQQGSQKPALARHPNHSQQCRDRAIPHVQPAGATRWMEMQSKYQKLGRLFSGNSSKPHAKASASVSNCLRRIAPEVTALKRGFCFSWGNALSPEVPKQVCLQPAAGLGSGAPRISPRDRDLAVMRGEGPESSANKRAQE